MQAEAVIYEVEPVSVSAPSGNAENLFSPWKIPGKNYYDWISDGKMPQNIIIDLGQVYSNINIINITPQHRCKPAPETSLIDGNITHCKIYSSTDNINFKMLTEEKWVADGKMRSITFSPQRARFLKIEVIEHEGENAVITQVQVGSSSEKPEAIL